MRLIDADAAAEEAVRSDKTVGSSIWETSEVVEFLDGCPTVDAVPVVHGRWESVHDGWGRCSNCHRMDEIHDLATHCRFCGAKMDGGENDDR